MPLSVMETYCMRRDKATFYTDLNGLHYTNLQIYNEQSNEFSRSAKRVL